MDKQQGKGGLQSASKKDQDGPSSQRVSDPPPRVENKPGDDQGALNKPPGAKEVANDQYHNKPKTTAAPVSKHPPARLKKRLPPSATISLDTRPHGPENAPNHQPSKHRLPVSLSRGALELA